MNMLELHRLALQPVPQEQAVELVDIRDASAELS